MGELVQYMNFKSLGPSECDLTPNNELDSDLEQSLKDWTDISHEYAVSKILKKTLWKFLVIFFCQNQIKSISHMYSFQKFTFVHQFIERFRQIYLISML